jgi:hypothetical protein
MAARIPHAVSCVQAVRAVATAVRREIDDRIDALNGHELTVVARMSRLAAWLASALHATSAVPLSTREAIG